VPTSGSPPPLSHPPRPLSRTSPRAEPPLADLSAPAPAAPPPVPAPHFERRGLERPAPRVVTPITPVLPANAAPIAGRSGERNRGTSRRGGSTCSPWPAPVGSHPPPAPHGAHAHANRLPARQGHARREDPRQQDQGRAQRRRRSHQEPHRPLRQGEGDVGDARRLGDRHRGDAGHGLRRGLRRGVLSRPIDFTQFDPTPSSR
jgi:hypothetical protein